MDQKEFEKLVQEGIAQIPKKFQKLLENVAIVIDDRPTREQLRKVKLPETAMLFGLYEGVPKTKRGAHYANVLPDKITIFKKAIESVAKDPENIKKIVKRTVWHEIAHHFGLSEKEVRQLEKKRFNK
jgi:predicted Zn-dependent protease with MMP-like domain